MIRDNMAFFLPLPLGGPPTQPPLPPGEGWGEGKRGKVHQLFGDKLNAIIEELNETLAA